MEYYLNNYIPQLNVQDRLIHYDNKICWSIIFQGYGEPSLSKLPTFCIFPYISIHICTRTVQQIDTLPLLFITKKMLQKNGYFFSACPKAYIC